MSTRRQVLLVTTCAIAVGVFLVTVPAFRHFFDLGVYRGAVHAWLLDGVGLYDYRYQGTEYGFTYPPFAALVFSPLIATSWPVAIALSIAVNAGAVVLLIRWFVVPVLRRNEWPIWTPCALAFLAVLVFEPARDTFSFGQVNLALLVLVWADLRMVERGGRWAGIGIGLATAIKLTPAVFIGYLVVTRQWRAAAVASGTTAAATALALVLAPESSRVFWTSAVWDTGRVGNLAYVSNQSLRGVVARLDGPPLLWLVLVVAAVGCWFLLVRRAPVATGWAATGVLACLISPVTWVHHLVWLLPALLVLAGAALDRRDRGRLVVLGVVFGVLSSSVVWLWWAGGDGWLAAVGSNTYVWISAGLMAVIGLRSPRRYFDRVGIATGPALRPGRHSAGPADG